MPHIVVAGHSAAYNNWFARTSGLDTTHQNAYSAYLDGLTTDGLFNSDGSTNFFDVLCWYANQTSGNAVLNMVSSSFTSTLVGPPAFTADRGFLGVDSSTTVYIDTNFNPATASSPKFTQNSAHISGWSNTNAASGGGGGGFIGLFDNSTNNTQLFPEYSDSKGYYRINDATPTGGIAVANSTGHYLANRSGASTQNGYKNAVDQGVTAASSGPVLNGTITFLAQRNTTSAPVGGSGLQMCMGSIGASLNSTQVTNFYNRNRTLATALGIP